MDLRKITITQEAVTAAIQLRTDLGTTVNRFKDLNAELYAVMYTVRDSVGPYSMDYENEIKSIIFSQQQIIDGLAGIAKWTDDMKEYLQSLLRRNGA